MVPHQIYEDSIKSCLFFLSSSRMKNVLQYLVVACFIISCSTPKDKIPPPLPTNKVASKLVVYQMMTRLFGNKTMVNKPFGTREENGVGKFSDINEAALESLKELGITHVWYTGIIEHALLADYTSYGISLDDADVVKGRAGSPYAIKDYYDVNPDLASNVPNRMKEFEQLVTRTHAHGLKVLIDFVPNHVARAYKSDAKPEGINDLGADDIKTVSFSQKNNFYYIPGESFQVPAKYSPIGKDTFATLDGKYEETPAKVTGNDHFTASPGINEWFETVKLNYGVDIQNQRKTYFDPIPDTWLKMKDILLFWANKNVDGFRCDMAEMVPVEFWNWVIPQVKEVNPEIIFIAEIYNPDHYKNYIKTGQFNFLYDKVLLYDTLRHLTTGSGSTLNIHDVQQRLVGINHHMLHFIENHDEQRVASAFFAGDPWKAIPSLLISATIDRGPIMIYFGQEVGESGAGAAGFQANDGRTTIFDYWGVPEHQKWMNDGKFDGALLTPEQKQLRQVYTDILNLASKNPAIHSGEYIDITQSNIAAGNFNNKVHAFLRYFGEERLLIVTSFNTVDQLSKIQIPAEAFKGMKLDTAATYIARDLLWRDAEVGFDKNLMFELKMKPFSSYIFKIK